MKITTLAGLDWLIERAASANESMSNVDVVQIGTYQANASHFVWFSATPEECKAASPTNPVMGFSKTQPGGKSMLAVLVTALVNKRKVDVQASGCSIF
ncbi:hypothetical protein GGR77_003838 [Xanthomonas translucens]